MELRTVFEFRKNSTAALLVLHEIYGVNRHILDLCAGYHALGFDVYCPNLYGIPTTGRRKPMSSS